MIRVKAGVEFGHEIAPAGMRILEVLKQIAAIVDFDITITSARDGAHSGPNDPHHTAEAFDLRTKGLTKTQKATLLASLQTALYQEPRLFYAFLEAPQSPNEHIHCQRRQGTVYSVADYLDNR